jgi:hypothetical protein
MVLGKLELMEEEEQLSCVCWVCVCGLIEPGRHVQDVGLH